MAKRRYRCPHCGYEQSKFTSKCPQCGRFEPFDEVEEDAGGLDAKKPGIKSVANRAVSTAKKLSSHVQEVQRFETGIAEFDRVLGGGFVEAEVALLGAEPGAGKSSLALHASEAFSKQGMTVLYASGEESEHQISLRAQRFGVEQDNIYVVHTTSLEDIRGHIANLSPDFVVVDSLQTVASAESTSGLGTISQSKAAAHALTEDAKTRGFRALLINQVNKNDEFAGSMSIQHIVDVALFLESSRDSPLKFLRALKNRFGAVDEVGIFEHAEHGLVGVSDPSGIFVDSEPLEGVAYGVSSEGIRQLPVEMQSLVVPSTTSNPKRRFNGLDYKRAEIICPILDKQLHTGLREYDVYASTFGGIKVSDPLADLAIAASIYSSRTESAMANKTVFIGEITPVGQVRGTHQLERKVTEAARMGFTHAVVPAGRAVKAPSGMQVTAIHSLHDLAQFFLGGK